MAKPAKPLVPQWKKKYPEYYGSAERQARIQFDPQILESRADAHLVTAQARGQKPGVKIAYNQSIQQLKREDLAARRQQLYESNNAGQAGSSGARNEVIGLNQAYATGASNARSTRQQGLNQISLAIKTAWVQARNKAAIMRSSRRMLIQELIHSQRREAKGTEAFK